MRLAYGGFGVDFQHGDPPAVVKLGVLFPSTLFYSALPSFSWLHQIELAGLACNMNELCEGGYQEVEMDQGLMEHLWVL